MTRFPFERVIPTDAYKSLSLDFKEKKTSFIYFNKDIYLALLMFCLFLIRLCCPFHFYHPNMTSWFIYIQCNIFVLSVKCMASEQLLKKSSPSCVSLLCPRRNNLEYPVTVTPKYHSWCSSDVCKCWVQGKGLPEKPRECQQGAGIGIWLKCTWGHRATLAKTSRHCRFLLDNVFWQVKPSVLIWNGLKKIEKSWWQVLRGFNANLRNSKFIL